MAEFIHGADSDVKNILNGNGDDYAALNGAIQTGNESWASSEQYAAGYLAVKYLHSKIQAAGAGFGDGIKHMTTWMKTEFDAGMALPQAVSMPISRLMGLLATQVIPIFSMILRGLQDKPL